MSRGRHALPEPPRSGLPLLFTGLGVAVAAIAAIWLVDDSLTVQVGATAIVVVLVVVVGLALRSDHQRASALWQAAMDRRHELLEAQRELSQLRAQQTELLLEIRMLRAEVSAASEETARGLQIAADRDVLMQELLKPRPAEIDTVYPSLHLPLVRAAFSAEIPPKIPSVEPDHPPIPETSTSGTEPSPPRQLLDLTASEIARLRPAN
ncbi:MAG TPA: hypothetical protein VFX15_10615 [Actinomycetes bacterium]|nr:hypothetical protein [Actinomycetes bacterium]